jgi:hypothetical protein
MLIFCTMTVLMNETLRAADAEKVCEVYEDVCV